MLAIELPETPPLTAEQIRRRILRCDLADWMSPVEIESVAKISHRRDHRTVCQVLIDLVTRGVLVHKQIDDGGWTWPGFRRPKLWERPS